MKRFEYKTVEKSYGFKIGSNEESEFLKNKGLEGWELFLVIMTAPNTTLNTKVYYFKKEVIG